MEFTVEKKNVPTSGLAFLHDIGADKPDGVLSQ